MRSFSKKLAFVLAAAMVVTSFAPAAKAEAAKEMAINKSEQILYVNEGINHKGGEVAAPGKGNVSVYDFSVKNKPADWKDTLSFKWTSSDTDVVTVKAGGVATAVGVGKATISCKITEKATGDVVTTAKTKVTVKANAYDVEITNADDVAGLAYEVGSTIDLNRAMYDEDGNKTTKRGKLVTDYTRWIAEPATGVEITQSNGKYTFNEAGEYTLYCETYQSSKYTKTTATSEKIKVTIEDTSIELKQTSLKKFDILVGAESNIAAADVAINEVVVGPSGEYRVPVLVKGVTMSADKKTATVELFYDMKDAVSYEVTVKGYDMQTLVASAGAPVAITAYAKDVTAGQVSVGKETELVYSLIDANGVDVTTGNDNEKNKVVFNLKYNGVSGSSYDMAYYAGYAKFTFTEPGDTAVVTAEYNTGEVVNGAEVKVTSPAITLYAVAKQLVTVKSVTNYTTQIPGWNNYWSADKDVVKLTQTNNLAVKVLLVDGKEVDITKQGQDIYDNENVRNGWVTVETTNSSKDFIDIDAVTGAQFVLRPRKVGTAQLMVYYNVQLPDGSIQKSAIAPITIKIKDAPTLGAVNLNYSGAAATTVLSINPNADSLKTQEVSIQIKDQYGQDYAGANFLEIKGSSAAADELVGSGISYVDGKIVVNSDPFRTKIHNMNTSSLAPDKIWGMFTYTVKYQDQTTWAIKSNTVVVDVRGLADSSIVGTDLAGTQNGNIARIKADDPWDAKNEKSLTFKVYDKMNSANFDLRNVVPYYTIASDVNAATEGYYFKFFKDGVDVTEKRLADGLLVFNGANEVTIRFSGTKTENNKTIVSYDNVGAGTYKFEVYKIEPSKYNAAVNVVTPVGTATKSVTVSCDPGKYTLTGRDNVIIKNADGKVPTDGAGTFTGSTLELLKCFNFADRNNNAFNKADWATSYSGQPNTDAKAIFGGGEYIDYVVTLNPELQKPNSVFVDSVTFYEDLGGVYASYKVDVKCYVEYQQQR